MREQLAKINFWYKLSLPFCALVASAILCKEIKLLWLTGWILNLIFILFMLSARNMLVKKITLPKLLLLLLGPIILGIFNLNTANGWGNQFIENTFLEMVSINFVIAFLSFSYNKADRGALPGMLMLTGFNLVFLYGLVQAWLEINDYQVENIHLVGLIISFLQIFYANISVVRSMAFVHNETTESLKNPALSLCLIFGWFSIPALVMLVKYLTGH